MSDNEPRERGEGFGAGARRAKRRGRASEAVHKASVPAGATALAVGAVLVAGGPGGRGGPRRGGGGRFGGRRKVCGFCVDKIGEVDYKDTLACADTSPSEARSSRAASSAPAPGTSAR